MSGLQTRGRFANPLPGASDCGFHYSNSIVWHIICGKGDQNSSELLSHILGGR